jgi:hypothetical protein
LEAVSDVEGQKQLTSADFTDRPNTLRKVEQEKQTPNTTLETQTPKTTLGIDKDSQTPKTTLETQTSTPNL